MGARLTAVPCSTRMKAITGDKNDRLMFRRQFADACLRYFSPWPGMLLQIRTSKHVRMALRILEDHNLCISPIST